MKRAEAEGKIRDAESRLRELQGQFQASQGSPIKLLQVAVLATSFGDSIANMTVTDNLTQRRKSLRDATSKLAADAQASALTATRV